MEQIIRRVEMEHVGEVDDFGSAAFARCDEIGVGHADLGQRCAFAIASEVENRRRRSPLHHPVAIGLPEVEREAVVARAAGANWSAPPPPLR